jgi:hypothetical protein
MECSQMIIRQGDMTKLLHRCLCTSPENFQFVYVTFVLVMYHSFIHLSIILKRHMDHGYVRLMGYICYRWLTPGGPPQVEQTHLHHRLYRWSNFL